MPGGDNGGAIIIHGTRPQFDRNGKSLIIDNQSSSLDLTLTEAQLDGDVATYGSTTGIGSTYVMVWGFGT